MLQTGHDLGDGSWHRIHFKYGVDEVSLRVDYGWPDAVKLDEDLIPSFTFQSDSDIVIGIGYYDAEPGQIESIPHVVKANYINRIVGYSGTGFVGCMRELKINDKKLDPRVLLSTGITREISLDNCQLVDPCDRPNACEHGGLCMVDEGRVVCDCTGTGYTGKNCHFGTFLFGGEEDLDVMSVDGPPLFLFIQQRCTNAPVKSWLCWAT